MYCGKGFHHDVMTFTHSGLLTIENMHYRAHQSATQRQRCWALGFCFALYKKLPANNNNNNNNGRAQENLPIPLKRAALWHTMFEMNESMKQQQHPIIPLQSSHRRHGLSTPDMPRHWSSTTTTDFGWPKAPDPGLCAGYGSTRVQQQCQPATYRLAVRLAPSANCPDDKRRASFVAIDDATPEVPFLRLAAAAAPPPNKN
jgi:hypothetical protein